MPEITCHVCGATSANPNDVTEGYCGRCHSFTGRPPLMTMWTIYDHPDDFPENVVVRGFDLFNGMTEAVPQGAAYLFDDLETARAWVQQEHPECVPFIEDTPLARNAVETWV